MPARARLELAASPSHRPEWVFWAALAPALAAIVGFGGVYSYIWAPVDMALFVAVLVFIWSRRGRQQGFFLHALLWPMAGFGLVVLAQWWGHLSLYPGATLTEFVQLAGCGTIFFLMLQAGHSPALQTRLGWALWLFCGLLALEAIFQKFGAGGYIYWFHNASYATPVGPFVYHNFYAGCMDLLLPIAVVVSFRPVNGKEPAWTIWLRRAMVPALGLVSVVISRSRGGILVLLAEVVLGLWVFWPEIKGSRHGRRNVAVGLVSALGFSALANWGPVVRRFGTLANHDASLFDRLHILAASWRIFLDHRWLGTGFNTFATVYPAYQALNSGLSVTYAHNDYAQALAETGIAGGLCILAFLLLWALAFRHRRQRRGAERAVRRLQLAAFIGTAGFLLHSAADFQFHAPGNALLFFLLLAAAVAPAHAHRTRSRNEMTSGLREERARRRALGSTPSFDRS